MRGGVERILQSNGWDASRAREVATTLTEGRWTHDYPITVEEACAMGLPVTADMPEEVPLHAALSAACGAPPERRVRAGAVSPRRRPHPGPREAPDGRSDPCRVVSLLEPLWQEKGTMERPLRIEELDHVVLRCRDPERALAFYVDILGLAEERRIEGIGLVQLRCGRSMLDLLPASDGADAPTPNVDHFCLGVDAPDMAAVARFLEARGVEVIGEPTPRYGARGMGLSIYLRDPEGNVVELKQTPRAEA